MTVIRDNPDRLREGLRKRNFPEDALHIVDLVIELDDSRKNLQTQLDELLAKRNSLSKEIGGLFKTGRQAEASTKKQEVADLKEKAALLETDLHAVKDKLETNLLQLPNIPNDKVPSGSTDEDNEVYQDWSGELPDLGDHALPHWELGEQYGILDMELGVKISGSGFPLIRGKGARLQRALIQFFLDQASEAGYEEIVPPLLVNEASARGTGQLPDKEGQMYYVTADDLYLIPTAEVPITNIYRGDILQEADFPIKLTGYTPCFRREAGSYGAHVRGLNRVHQFDKVEVVQIQHPDKSYDTLYEMIKHVAGILDKLELPYRILRLCGGDLGFTSALTYDFEVYSAAQKRWLEVSSVSNFETYQANRMKLRFRDGKSTRLVHTLNGSALALARIMAALLENNQSPEGIHIPEALQSYTGFSVIN